MLLLLTLACDAGEDSAATYTTSETVIEISGVPSNQCVDDELTLQVGFLSEVPRVQAEVASDNFPDHEFHEVPFGGMDEDTGEIFLYERKLETSASAASDDATTFSCGDAPYAAFRVFDDEGALMACYFGEFTASAFDKTGCPE